MVTVLEPERIREKLYQITSEIAKRYEEMHEFMEQKGYELDITDKRLHHEIYLSDARKIAPEKLKTVIRHPIKAKGE